MPDTKPAITDPEHILNRSPSWWQALSAIIIVVVMVVGGLLSIKGDIQSLQYSRSSELESIKSLADTVRTLSDTVAKVDQRQALTDYQSQLAVAAQNDLRKGQEAQTTTLNALSDKMTRQEILMQQLRAR